MRIQLIILISLLFGCASNVPRMTAEEWFDQESSRWVAAVSSSCKATHENFNNHTSPVDCISNPPSTLSMSFPSKPFFVEHEQGVGDYLNAWCVAVMNRHGNNPAVQIFLREENVLHEMPCQIILNKVKRMENESHYRPR